MTPIGSTPALPPSMLTADQLLAAEQQGLAEVVNDADRYWADRKASDVVAELNKKEREYYQFLRSSGHLDMWRVAYCQQHGLDPNDDSAWVTQTVNFAGTNDELLYFRIGETRSFVDQLVTMSIGHRPAFDAFATNSDYESIGMAEAGEAIVTYVYEESYGERKERQTVERAFWYGSAYTWIQWDPNGGDQLPPTPEPKFVTLPDGTTMPALDQITGEQVMRMVPSDQRTGGVVLKSLAPWMQFCEPRLDDPDDHMWRCVRTHRSRHELAGLFPELRDQILAMPATDEHSFAQLMVGSRNPMVERGNSDLLTVKHFYHRGSAAFGEEFRNGRRITYVGDVPLIDVPLEYRVLPVIPLIPKTYYETSFGYSTVWDLICCNQLIDDVMVNSATNLSNFGRQSIWVEEGTSISAKDIVNGGKLLKGKVNSKPPQVVSLAAIPESAKWFLDQLRSYMQSMSGLNSVSRGEPDASITSGTMAALFHSIALEFNSGPQAAVDGHREDVANLILDVLKYSAEHPMIMKIAGKDERQFMDSFTRDDLYGVRGVRLRTANPMLRTQSGRMELAQTIIKSAPPGTYDPERIVEIAISGQVKPLYDAPRKRRMLIKLEDELLQDAPPFEEVTPPPQPPLPNGMQIPPPPPYQRVPSVPVGALQNHRDHIYSHEALLCSKEGMVEGPFRAAVLAHIAEHKYVWQNSDPAFLSAMGLPVWPGGPPGPPPAMGPGMGPGPSGPMPPRGGPAPANDNAEAQTGVPPTQRSADDLTGTPLPKPAQPPKAA